MSNWLEQELSISVHRPPSDYVGCYPVLLFSSNEIHHQKVCGMVIGY